MNILFLILTTGIAGYVAYAYVFGHKHPTPHSPAAESMFQDEKHSSKISIEMSVASKRWEPKEVEALSLAMLTKDPTHAFETVTTAAADEAASLSVQSIMSALHAWAFQTFYAGQKRARIQATCLHEFPEMLDILTLGLKAGLSFDGSLELYTSRYNSMLSAFLSQSMIAWKLGLCNRIDALDMLSSHLEIGALTRFSMAVAEALEFGIPLADSLSRQATEIRREQRLQVEEGIEKIPVKMLIPMGVFVVPAMLLAILGPLLSSALKMG